MRIAVITANLGGIDAIHPIAEQDISFDRIYITDENNKFPFHTSNSRLAASRYWDGSTSRQQGNMAAKEMPYINKKHSLNLR